MSGRDLPPGEDWWDWTDQQLYDWYYGPDEPAPSSAPYIPDNQLDPSLQPEFVGPPEPEPFVGPPERIDTLTNVLETPTYVSGGAGPWEQPTYPGSISDLPLVGETVRTGVLPENTQGIAIIDTLFGAIGNVVKFVGDTGKFILDHLQISAGYTGSDNTGQKAATVYQTSQQTTAADLAKLQAQYYADLVARGQMTADEAIARGVALGIDTLASVTPTQTYLTTPTVEEEPNYLLYAGLAIAAIMILKGR
jgi:hypothetical protein